jgi:hypothetical protein
MNAQKMKRVDVASELLERQRREPFLHNLITMDETWIPYKNPKPQNAWIRGKRRVPSTPRPDFRQKKIMLSVFWGPNGIIHW